MTAPRKRKPATKTTAKSTTTAKKRSSSVSTKKAPVVSTEAFSSSGQTQKLISANLFLFAAIFILCVTNFFTFWFLSKSKVEVIAVTETGQLAYPAPLNVANVPDSRVLGFVDECVRASFSHDFENYRRTMNHARECYTTLGRTSFMTAFEPLLQDIVDRRLVMSVTTETPVVVRGPYLFRGVVAWDVETVITLFFHGTRERFPQQRRAASIRVVQVPLEENPRGLGLEAIQLAPYSGR